MRSLSILLLLALAPFPAGAQTDTRKVQTRPRSAPSKPAPKASPTPTPRDPKAELEAAKETTDPLERLNSLLKFISEFPDSAETLRARELSVSARAEVAESKLASGDTEEGVRQFMLAAEAAPTPVSDELFSKVLLQFPTNLFARDQRAAAFDVAAVIETKSAGNAKQLLALATFYIGLEYSSEAYRLAAKAVETAPDLALGYYTLGTAARLGFRLDDAASAFAKALELEPDSIAARRNLADLRRATGKSDEAVKLYGEIVAKDPDDTAARSALALALFDLGKKDDAEKEMETVLAADPTDAGLLTGAAFWYAANGEGAKAVGLGARAKAADPKNIWAYIAEARGHVAQKNPLEAERVLLLARTVGGFPTLDYELASARFAAGLYREAVEALAQNFSVKDGLVSAYLGNRVLADAETLPQLLSLEHKASILAPDLRSDVRTAAGLKNLLEFAQAIGGEGAPDEKSAVAAAETFAAGDDNMRSHRQLFAASRLLQNNIAADKALELTRASITGLDSSVDVDAPAAAVLADELYESRVTALQRGELVIVPRIDKQTLTSIMRGRVEELSGWALLLKNEPDQAILRIRRGLTVLPEESAWWRSSQWRLGNALEAQGKQKEAIEAYIRSFNKEYPNPSQYQYIENLYMQVNGNLDGLEARIGRNPATAVARVEPTPTPTPVPTPEVMRIPDVVPIASPTPTPEAKVDESPKEVPSKIDENVPNVEPKAEPSPESTTIPVEEKKEESKAEPTPAPVEEKKEEPKVEPTPTPVVEEKKEEPKAEPTPEPAPTPVVEEKKEEPKAEPTPEPSPAPVDEKKEEPSTPTAPTTPATSSTPEPTPVVEEKKEEPKVEPTPEPTPAPVEEKKEDPKIESSLTPTTPSTPPTPEPTPVEEKKEQKPAPKPLFEPIIITAPARPATSEARPRIAPKTPETTPCTVVPTRDEVSIFADGGLWGLLVGVENGLADDLKAVSDSPADVTVTLGKGPDGETERKFFVIRSVSGRTGDFKVTFTAPCGSKDISVRVRGL